MAEDVLDYLVIGAGPAGLQLGHHLDRAGHRYLVLEAGAAPGTFFTRYPRHRQLISVNKKHTGWADPELNLRMDWNSLLADDPDPLLFTAYSDLLFPDAEDFLRYVADYAEKYAVAVRYNARVTRVSRDGDGFAVTDTDGAVYRARRVVVATGVSRPYVPDVPGMEFAEQYENVSVEPGEFLGKRVLVIGKGNSAFETADNLIASAAVVHVGGPGGVRLAWRTHFVGHLRAINAGVLDMYQLKLQHAVLDGEIREIRRAGDSYVVSFAFSRADEVVKDLRYDRVIACTGFRFDASIFDEDCRPELTINNRFPDQTPYWESVNVPGLYFAGTLSQVRDYRKSTSAFIHGYRYSVRALAKALDERYHGKPWPSVAVPADVESLADAVIARVNRTSALYQQFGFLADILTVDGGEARYHEEMPIALFAASDLSTSDNAFVVTLDYGPDHDKIDPFDANVARARQDAANDEGAGHYLHPIVRHYRRGELVATHHVTENLENEWNQEIHIGPLRAFLARQLEPVVARA
ncbi:NAD(P)-binding domain-containing protein [Amycolatopsis samaneae]|uniref:NAD(P)-binding domain-containing protein n=1 Tax=Amycolatopsis samaneae TaxID=664691 RepID=A0ABW5GGY4_9PSEU